MSFTFLHDVWVLQIMDVQPNVYHLYCPVPQCGEEMHGMWFAYSGDRDEHGYMCCSKCVTQVVKLSNVPRKKWMRLTRKDIRSFPKTEWRVQMNAHDHFLKRLCAPTSPLTMNTREVKLTMEKRGSLCPQPRLPMPLRGSSFGKCDASCKKRPPNMVWTRRPPLS